MKIGIDIQALQTINSRNRGIGRYTQSVVENLLSQHNVHSYQLYANSTLPVPEFTCDRFSYLNIDYPQIGSSVLNDLLMKTTMISADIEAIFVPSPMEGLDSTIPDYTNFSKKVFVICYDLIPLIFPDKYLNDPNMYSLYMRRLKNIKVADFIFAISESTRQDVIKYLSISPDKVLNISGGVSAFFTPIPTSERQNWLKVFAKKFGINRKFILYTGGEDWRKNIEGLLKAFAKLPKNLQESHQIVVACKVSDFFAQEIVILASKLGISSSLVLTNYVTDEELRAFYSTCSLFVFPSFYEGFGLPLLEAISCGAPAIASNNSSLPEIVDSDEQLFDPRSIEDMTLTIQKVLVNKNYQEKLAETALKQAAKFTWQSVAQKISDVFKYQQTLNKTSLLFNRIQLDHKPKIAFFSPFSPLKSGIANYSQDLIPSLAKSFDLELFHDDDYTPDLNISNKLYSHSQFEERLNLSDYEAIVYQIGNSSYHCYAYSQLSRYPGISVLHDYYLGGLINYLDNCCPKLNITLLKELEHCYGQEQAKDILDQLQKGLLNIHEKLIENDIYLNRRIFTRSLGVILHSQWAYERAVSDFRNDCQHITRIPLVVPQYKIKENDTTNTRLEFGVPDDSFVVSSFGFVNITKRPLQIIHAFKKYLSSNPLAYLIFVGGTDYLGATDIEQEVNKLNLHNKVKITNYVSMSDFYRYIEISDICINLRFPSNGESSASLLRILSVGKPTIITNINSFADFPDDVVFKIPQPIEADEIEEIYRALVKLTENPEYRSFLSYKAFNYVKQEHSPEYCARLYAEFIEKVVNSPQTKVKMLADYVGRETAKLEVTEPQKIITLFSKVIGNISC